jgi:ribose transport system permease protein
MAEGKTKRRINHMGKYPGYIVKILKDTLPTGTLLRRLGIWFWLIVFGVIFSLILPYFFSTRNFFNIARQASIFGIMAIGMTFVIISGGIDLSVGSIVSFTSAVFGFVWQFTGNIFLSIACGLLVGILSGAMSGVLVGYVGLPPFIATFGMMGVGAGLAFGVTPSSIGGFPPAFEFLGNGKIATFPVPVFFLIFFTTIAYYMLKKTKYGLRLLAIGGSETSAKLAGIDIKRYKLTIYILNGVLASIASIILCARIRSSYPGVGEGFELDVIAATVIGGANLMGGEGSILGAVGGALFIIMIQNVFNLFGIYPFVQKVITGAFIVVAVLAKTNGRLARQ